MDSKLSDQIIDLLCTHLEGADEKDFTLIRPLKEGHIVVEYKNERIAIAQNSVSSSGVEITFKDKVIELINKPVRLILLKKT